MDFLLRSLFSFVIIFIIVFGIDFAISSSKKERDIAKEEKNDLKNDNKLSKILYYGTTLLLIVYDLVCIPIYSKMSDTRISTYVEDVVIHPQFYDNIIIIRIIGIAIILMGIIIKLLLKKKIKYKKIDLYIWILALIISYFIYDVMRSF